MPNPNTDHSAAGPESQVVNTQTGSTILYSFVDQGKGKWRVQDDVVMGGRSDSQLKMTEDNYAQFSGRVTLENNGGFCSIHQTVETNPYVIDQQASVFVLRLNGDGKDYSFRVRTPNGRHLYSYTFSTQANDDWETITVPFQQMSATFHGEPVAVPNYAGEEVVEMQLLIGNKKEETFEVLVQSIGVE